MATAMLVAPQGQRRTAAVAGLAAGLLPDADIFLISPADPLFSLEYHRHFTHSFAFSPVMMLLAAGLANCVLRVFRRPAPFRSLLWPALVAVWSHIFCDLWTSYGTRAFWPFTDDRSALDWVSVIDPLLTLPLVVLVLVGLVRNRLRPIVMGLIWVGCYLTGAVLQQKRATAALEALMAASGHVPVRYTVKPSFGNIVVWRAIYEVGGFYHVAAIRCGAKVAIYEGERVAAVRVPSGNGPWELPHSSVPLPTGSVQVRDVARFAHFSDNWLAWHPEIPGVLGDMRYAQVPNRIAPLWGIRFDTSRPQEHVKMQMARRNDPQIWQTLWAMILGREIPAVPSAALSPK
jgi:inner membrane protein